VGIQELICHALESRHQGGIGLFSSLSFSCFICFSLHPIGSFSPSCLFLRFNYLVMTTIGPSLCDQVCSLLQISKLKRDPDWPKSLLQATLYKYILQPALMLAVPESGLLQLIGPWPCLLAVGTVMWPVPSWP
jgi:hypothetical protein